MNCHHKNGGEEEREGRRPPVVSGTKQQSGRTSKKKRKRIGPYSHSGKTVVACYGGVGTQHAMAPSPCQKWERGRKKKGNPENRKEGV